MISRNYDSTLNSGSAKRSEKKLQQSELAQRLLLVGCFLGSLARSLVAAAAAAAAGAAATVAFAYLLCSLALLLNFKLISSRLNVVVFFFFFVAVVVVFPLLQLAEGT